MIPASEECLTAGLYYRLLAVAAPTVGSWENVYGLTATDELVCEGGHPHGQRLIESKGQSAHQTAERLLRRLDPWNGKTKDYQAVFSVRDDEGVLNVYHHYPGHIALCRPASLTTESVRLRPSALAGAWVTA